MPQDKPFPISIVSLNIARKVIEETDVDNTTPAQMKERFAKLAKLLGCQ